MMGVLYAQILVTLRRLIKNKLLIGVLIIAILLLALISSSIVVSDISTEVGQLESAGGVASALLIGLFFLIWVFSGLVAIILGVTTVRADIEGGTIFSVLSKPIKRWEYLVGTYAASVIYLLLVWSIFAVLFFGMVDTVEGSIDKLHVLMFGGRVLLSVLLLSLAFFLSQIFNPWIAAALTLLVYHGESLVDLIDLVAWKLAGPLSSHTKAILGYIFPAPDRLDGLFEMLGSRPVEIPEVTWAFLHLGDYSLVMLVLAVLVFNRRELSHAAE